MITGEEGGFEALGDDPGYFVSLRRRVNFGTRVKEVGARAKKVSCCGVAILKVKQKIKNCILHTRKEIQYGRRIII